MQNQPNQTMDNSVICMTYFQNYPDRKFVSCMTSRTELSILKILSKKIILDEINPLLTDALLSITEKYARGVSPRAVNE